MNYSTYTLTVEFEDGNQKSFSNVFAASLQEAVLDIEDAHQMSCTVTRNLTGSIVA